MLPQDNLQWLDSSNIIKSMLKGSLHQKQYVDQVQRILQYLLQDGFMTSEHLDLLWGVTEKVGLSCCPGCPWLEGAEAFRSLFSSC